MCDYCQGEGCACGNSADYPASCQSQIIGTKVCSVCGCQSSPWWSDLKIPGGDGISDLMWDLEHSEKSFPATKTEIVRSVPDSEDARFLSENLPEQTYKDTGDIMGVLIKLAPTLGSERQPTDIIWKNPAEAIPPGQRLVVDKDQVAVMVSKTGKACDEFAQGNYVISNSNCPALAQESRKVLPGYPYSVLNGFPVFVSPVFEFEIDLTTMGQTRALRRVMAKGIARVRISSPKAFVEQIGRGSKYDSQQVLAALSKYSADILKGEMSVHELNELSGNNSILEKPLADGLSKAGLYPVKISFTYVGDFGPGAFTPTPGQMNDPKSAEQMKQMAESMRAAQMAKLQAIQQMMQQRGLQPASAPQISAPQTVSCPSCNSQNPQSSKFCNNCGKLLQVSKKTCPSCGKLSDPAIKFCGNCGTKLN